MRAQRRKQASTDQRTPVKDDPEFHGAERQVFLNGPGQVIRVAPDGARTTVVDGLNWRPRSWRPGWDDLGEVLKLRH